MESHGSLYDQKRTSSKNCTFIRHKLNSLLYPGSLGETFHARVIVSICFWWNVHVVQSPIVQNHMGRDLFVLCLLF